MQALSILDLSCLVWQLSPRVSVQVGHGAGVKLGEVGEGYGGGNAARHRSTQFPRCECSLSKNTPAGLQELPKMHNKVNPMSINERNKNRGINEVNTATAT